MKNLTEKYEDNLNKIFVILSKLYQHQGQNFFSWYNTEHYHSGIGYLKPEDVLYGTVSSSLTRSG